MKPTTRHLCSIAVQLAAVSCLIATSILAGDQSKSPDAGRSVETNWEALLGREPESTRAILQLAKTPGETIKFLAERLQPLKLTDDRLETLLGDLQSSDDGVWQSAFQELEYFDPRLASGLEDLLRLDSMNQAPARNRLVAVLSGRTTENIINYKTISLRPVGDDGFNFIGSDNLAPGGSSWWAEHKLERLNEVYSTQKHEWTRIVRAICLLESFGTPESLAIIKRLSEGHPDAQPTRVALEVLADDENAELGEESKSR